jgi:hypothetical protein
MAAKFGAGLPSLFDSRHRRIVAGKVNRFIGRDRFRGSRSPAPAPTIKEQHQRPEYLPRHGLEGLKQHRAAGGHRAGILGGLSRIDLTCCWSEFRKW